MCQLPDCQQSGNLVTLRPRERDVLLRRLVRLARHPLAGRNKAISVRSVRHMDGSAEFYNQRRLDYTGLSATKALGLGMGGCARFPDPRWSFDLDLPA